jgi:hypothetical protein
MKTSLKASPLLSNSKAKGEVESSKGKRKETVQVKIRANFNKLKLLTYEILKPLSWEPSKGISSMIMRNKSYVVGERTYSVSQTASMGHEPSGCCLAVSRGDTTLSFLFNDPDDTHISVHTKLSESSSRSVGVPSSLTEDPNTSIDFLGKLETFLAELSIAVAEETHRPISNEIDMIRSKLDAQKILSLI